MKQESAGILLYRLDPDAGIEVFLVHPGGPYWAHKEVGAWSIPKGEMDGSSDRLAVAKREFAEETGQSIEGEFLPLQPIRQAGGKIVHAWAVAGDIAADALRSNTFSMEWPPRSGRQQSFPEVDRGAWFSFVQALEKINGGQRDFLHQLRAALTAR